MIFGDLGRLLAQLYQLLVPIAIGLIVAIGVLAYLARHRRWTDPIRGHRLASVAVAAVFPAVGAPVGWVLGSPLFIRTELSEDSPLMALEASAEPGRYTLRLEDLSVRKGPDLFVYLSPSNDGNADAALELGDLKATDGSFNSDVPAGTEIDGFRSVVVWCRAFSVQFATAPLSSG